MPRGCFAGFERSELRFPLFKRSRTGVSPTTAGAAFLGRAMASGQLLDLAARHAVAVDSDKVGQVRVGIASSRTGGLIGKVLRQFKALFPSVYVTLTEDTTSKSSHNVAMGTIDVAFLIGTECNPVCETRVLWREAILAALGNTHRLFDHQASRLVGRNGPYDLILEEVGGSRLAEALMWLASLGVCVLFGDASEETLTSIDARRFRLQSGGTFGGTVLYGFFLLEEQTRPEGAADGPALLADFALQLSNGSLRAVIGETAPWDNIDLIAFELLNRKFAGEVVITLDEWG